MSEMSPCLASGTSKVKDILLLQFELIAPREQDWRERASVLGAKKVTHRWCFAQTFSSESSRTTFHLSGLPCFHGRR